MMIFNYKYKIIICVITLFIYFIIENYLFKCNCYVFNCLLYLLQLFFNVSSLFNEIIN